MDVAGHAPDRRATAASKAVRGPPRRSPHEVAAAGRARTLGRGRGGRSGVGLPRDPGPGGPGTGERGAAVVELLVVFLTLLVPLVYVMVVMADVQRALLATSSAAREAGRVYVTGSDRSDAERRAALAYREVLGTYGMRAGDPKASMRLRVGCPDEGGVGVCRWVRARGGGPGGRHLSGPGGPAAVPG